MKRLRVRISSPKEKRGSFEGAIRIPLHASLFLFIDLAFLAIPRKSFGFLDLVVSQEQKIALRRLLQQPRNWRSLAFRARVVLERASGKSNPAVAPKLRTPPFTLRLWRNRFIPDVI